MYEIFKGIAPNASEYCELRLKAGMTPKDIDMVSEALESSLFNISIRTTDNGTLVAMGRITGDFTAMQIVDIAVAPEHQGNKLGNKIMSEIMNFIKLKAPKSCFINLFADVDFLYGKFGFVQPKRTKGMMLDWSKVN